MNVDFSPSVKQCLVMSTGNSLSKVDLLVPRRILCVIDSLGSGGAQRQMINLACGLKLKGHEVELFIYHPHQDFYRLILDKAGIPVNEVQGASGFSFKVVMFMTRMQREKKFEALISFLPSANIYTILCKLFSWTNAYLVVGERASKASELAFFRTLIQRSLYTLATKVVVNSCHQAEYLKNFFWLRNKVLTIYNGYLISNNLNADESIPKMANKFLIIGRVDAGKNGIRLLKALDIFYQRNGYIPEISWVGRQEKDQQSLLIRAEMDQLIATRPSFEVKWQWLGERSDVPQLLVNCDALLHVSLYEGLPNVVCEAFIAGRPVIASAVCDHPLLVKDGVRGLLCDPLSPESICIAIERFIALPLEERKAMGRNARQYAEEHLTLERMVDEYEALLT